MANIISIIKTIFHIIAGVCAAHPNKPMTDEERAEVLGLGVSEKKATYSKDEGVERDWDDLEHDHSMGFVGGIDSDSMSESSFYSDD